jgi:hypothetical protein
MGLAGRKAPRAAAMRQVPVVARAEGRGYSPATRPAFLTHTPPGVHPNPQTHVCTHLCQLTEHARQRASHHNWHACCRRRAPPPPHTHTPPPSAPTRQEPLVAGHQLVAGLLELDEGGGVEAVVAPAHRVHLVVLEVRVQPLLHHEHQAVVVERLHPGGAHQARAAKVALQGGGASEAEGVWAEAGAGWGHRGGASGLGGCGSAAGASWPSRQAVAGPRGRLVEWRQLGRRASRARRTRSRRGRTGA